MISWYLLGQTINNSRPVSSVAIPEVMQCHSQWFPLLRPIRLLNWSFCPVWWPFKNRPEYRLCSVRFPLLNTQLHKYKFADSPLCPCGRSDETIEHFLMNCPPYMEACDSMIAKIENGFNKTSTQPHLRCINTNVLLGSNPHLSTAMCSIIKEAVAGFLPHAPHQF